MPLPAGQTFVGDTIASAAPPAANVGADCSPVGSAAATANGNTVYCSTLEGTGATIWSVSQGFVAAPTITVTTQAADEPLPVERGRRITA